MHSLTLQQALEISARQNPDVALARLDEQRAEQGIKVAEDPFRPKIYGGSGLAYTYGYPNSIDGNAPSLAQLRTDMARQRVLVEIAVGPTAWTAAPVAVVLVTAGAAFRLGAVIQRL